MSTVTQDDRKRGNAVLVGSPQYITDTLQRVLNAAARFVSGTRKFDQGLSRLLHDELHWLSVPERVQYKLAVTVHRCLQNKAPSYLVDCCIPVSDVVSRQHLWSASRHFLTVPRFRRNTFGRRAFSVGGTTAGIHYLTVFGTHHTAAVVSGII